MKVLFTATQVKLKMWVYRSEEVGRLLKLLLFEQVTQEDQEVEKERRRRRRRQKEKEKVSVQQQQQQQQ